MLGGSTLGIGVTMFLRDQFSGPAARVKSSAGQLYLDMQKLQAQQQRQMQQRNMYAGLAIGGVMALRGMGRMVKKAAEYSYEMEFVKSITNATGQEQEKLSSIAKSLGRETMFFPQAIAEGMRFMAMAGMSAQQVEKNIQGAVNLAGATKSQLGGVGGAADIMTNVMKQFKIGFEYTNDVADRLAYGTTRANMNLFQLGEALKYAGATAMDLNMSLDETIAMSMALGNAGLQGSMAGVAMENAMRYMSRAVTEFGSGPSKKAIAMLGMQTSDFLDQKGDLLSMTQIIQNMGKALEGAYQGGGNAEKQAILQSIFGVRGKRAGSLLIRNLKEFEQFTNDVSKLSGGHALNIMGDMMDTLQGQLFRLGSAWEAMWVSFTERIGPTIIFLLKGITKAFTFLEKLFNMKVLGGAIATGIAGFLTLSTVVFAYKTLSYGLKAVHTGIQMSALAMSGSTVAGYNAMTGAAITYSAAARAAAVASVRGMTTRGVVGVTKTGALYRRVAGAKGTAGKVLGAGLAARYASRYGAKVAGGRAALGLVTKGAGAVAGGVLLKQGLGKLLGLLGGPWGFALAFGLPAVIGILTNVLGKNSQKVAENSKALHEDRLKKLTDSNQYGRMEHAMTFMDLAAPAVQVLGSTHVGMKGELSPSVASQLRQALESKVSGTDETLRDIIVYVGDEEVYTKRIKDHMKANNDSINGMLGL